MKQFVLGAALVGVGTVIGAVSSDNTTGTANAQFASPSTQSGDALWHLPRFGEQGGSYM
jgi:leucyl aminopeptidase